LALDSGRSDGLSSSSLLARRQLNQPLGGQSIENISDRYVFELTRGCAPIPKLSQLNGQPPPTPVRMRSDPTPDLLQVTIAYLPPTNAPNCGHGEYRDPNPLRTPALF